MKHYFIITLLLLFVSFVNAQRMFDGFGRQIGRFEGMGAGQAILFFYFFM